MSKPGTLIDWQKQLVRELSAVTESPLLDAQVLLAHVLGCNRSWVLAHPEKVLTNDQEQDLLSARQALLQGQPLPYVLGRWEFFGLDFLVSPQVLIPRPETELLVEQALQWLKKHPEIDQVLEVGTGSGCIAISLAVHQPVIEITATDISPDALRIAHQNAQRHSVSQKIYFLLSDLLESITGRFGLLCANLPYIPAKTLENLSVAKNEPLLALNGGEGGLEIIRRFLQQAPFHITKESLLLVEIEAGQGQAVVKLAKEIFPTAQISLLQDLSGLDRLLRVENRF